ncbi:hypothetical protein [Halochromatium salexigens]|uniref:hypothetical protein n=1 Tax=Halochromatium salexigens TaxID=49447 RepID=UPI00191364AA|nr:hypothetical protein [Halochromatium salexigens]
MIIIDTGFWFGLMDRRDQYHKLCRRFLALSYLSVEEHQAVYQSACLSRQGLTRACIQIHFGSGM